MSHTSPSYLPHTNLSGVISALRLVYNRIPVQDSIREAAMKYEREIFGQEKPRSEKERLMIS